MVPVIPPLPHCVEKTIFFLSSELTAMTEIMALQLMLMSHTHAIMTQGTRIGIKELKYSVPYFMLPIIS